MIWISGVLRTRPFFIDGHFSIYGRDHHRAKEGVAFHLAVYDAVIQGKVIHLPGSNHTAFDYTGLKTPQFIVQTEELCEGHDE